MTDPSTKPEAATAPAHIDPAIAPAALEVAPAGEFKEPTVEPPKS
jgi:hypothetical protein